MYFFISIIGILYHFSLHIIESFTSKRSAAKLLALVFEEKESYLGKEVCLFDMIDFCLSTN